MIQAFKSVKRKFEIEPLLVIAIGNQPITHFVSLTMITLKGINEMSGVVSFPQLQDHLCHQII